MFARNKKYMDESDDSVIDYTETSYLPFSDRQIYNLITDVERYPEFLPGWLSVNVNSRDEKHISASQEIGVSPVSWEFNSIAELDSLRHVHVSSNDGPFQYLDIHWNLDAITRKSVRVTLTVRAAIAHSARSVVNLFLKKSVHSLLENFANRAREIYG